MQIQVEIIFIIVFSTFAVDSTFTQQIPAPVDSSRLYQDIQTYSKKNKFTIFLHKLVFKQIDTTSSKKKVKKKVNRKPVQKPYKTFENKIIRNIVITTLDPFGYSVSDTNVSRQNFLTNTGNKIHVKTQNFTIRNLLLIHRDQKFDSLLVKESERLVRSRMYVRDVSFFVKTVSKNSDSVDIYIRELDNWSIIPGFSASSPGFSSNFTDKNFAGLGHEFQFVYIRNYVGNNSFRIDYSIQNIRNTFISTKLHYDVDGYNNFNKGITVDRPFFSPFARWAAGVSLTQKFQRDSVKTTDSFFVPQRFKFNTQDFWAGKAFRLSRRNTEISRTTNFIAAVRYLRIRFLEKPVDMFESQPLFLDEDFYMLSFGISTRRYVQDRFIYKYGLIEDVPVGKVLNITGGYQKNANGNRGYVGGRISSGKYYPWGYLSYSLEYGSFFRKSGSEQGNLTVSTTYFTGLIESGKLKLRQFIKPQVVIGLNRMAYDSLTLNDGTGLNGFNSSILKGTSRILLTLQTQFYSPWNIIGFHFGPYFTCSFGMLGNERNGFKKSKIYSQVGIGVLIKNDNLVLNTFQISVAFYPLIPGTGENIFKVNSFKTTDFGFMDFEIGKPSEMIFK